MNVQRSTGLAMLLGLTAAAVQAPVSRAPILPSRAVVSLTQHAPMRLVGPAPNQWGRSDLGIYESDNWAGYAVVGTAFTEARGSWTVPSVDCTVNPNGAASFWVGIDGWNNDTVEQTGTESQCNGFKLVTYAWYEFAPKAGVTIKSIRVTPGEDMEGEVRYVGSRFVVTLTDLTTGRYFRTSSMVPRAKRSLCRVDRRVERIRRAPRLQCSAPWQGFHSGVWYEFCDRRHDLGTDRGLRKARASSHFGLQKHGRSGPLVSVA